ncbi:MAG: GAF domain-containing protein, partial [Opitutaceae bacterium]|nr:GAF domain-containing protein [Cytophagales bacterium]
MFRNACRLAIEFGSFKMAWIGLFDIEERIIDLVEQNGIPEEDLKLFVKAPFADDGPQGKALKSGPYFLCNNISRDLNLVNWKPFAEKYNINSCILLPLKRSGQIIGTLNLYASEIDFLHSKELEILTKVAEDISFTLDILDKAEKQSSTEEKLIKSERQFRHTLDNLLEGIQIIDFDWKYLYVNEALVRQSYYSKEELIGFTPMDKYPGFENTLLFKLMEKCLKERSEATFNNEFTFPDGSNGYFELSIRSIPEGISILSIDRSGKKRAEEKLLKVNRLYSFLSAVNQSIVHINDEQELLRNACSIAT